MNKSLKNYTLIRLCKVSPEDVLLHIKDEFVQLERGSKPERAMIGGYRIKTGTLRLVTFKTRGLKCACCGLEGAFFAIETQKEDIPPHMNLYAINDDGKEVLMTHDHIIPKSKGGTNRLENCQTMCKPCNEKKGNKQGG